MFPVCRTVANSSRRLLRSPPRRFNSGGHSHHDAHAHHDTPKEEHFSRGFYITLASVPIGYGLYRFIASDSDPWPTRMIRKYSDMKEMWRERNDLHVRMVDQAGNDRALFLNSPVNRVVELRFQEIFNTGCPYNVSAGQGGINLDKVIAHYEEENRNIESQRLERVRKWERREGVEKEGGVAEKGEGEGQQKGGVLSWVSGGRW